MSDQQHRLENIFSPDGTLLQVEYALEAAKKGMACSVVLGKESIAFAASKRVPEKLMDPSGMSSFFLAYPGIVGVASGLQADVQHMVDKARTTAADLAYELGHAPTPDILSRRIADTLQEQTQKSAERLDAVNLALLGYEGPKGMIYHTDTSGSLLPYNAIAFGEGSAMMMKKLEKIYKPDLSHEETVESALIALSESLGPDYLATNVEVAYVRPDSLQMTHLSLNEVDHLLSQIAEKI